MVYYHARNLAWTRKGRPNLGAGTVTPPPANDPGWVDGWGLPTFRDEFDYTDPTTGQPAMDPAKWNIRDRSTFGLLNDATVISRDKVQVKADGPGGTRLCHIYGTWRETPVITSTGPSSPDPTERWHDTGYFEHRLTNSSSTIYSQQYGRWEICAKVPTGPNTLGALAAFWLRNQNSGEIDIMESWGWGQTPFATQNPGTSTLTTHTNTSGTGNIKKAWTIESVLGVTKNVYADFHVWTLEFTPSYFRGYRDGLRFCNETPSSYPNLWNPSYWGSPNHMRVNLHIGPSTLYWGLPDPDNKSLTQDPLDYQIKYIRAWRWVG